MMPLSHNIGAPSAEDAYRQPASLPMLSHMAFTAQVKNNPKQLLLSIEMLKHAMAILI